MYVMYAMRVLIMLIMLIVLVIEEIVTAMLKAETTVGMRHGMSQSHRIIGL
jgi:hypothetical protein